jgi:hypothetical protein
MEVASGMGRGREEDKQRSGARDFPGRSGAPCSSYSYGNNSMAKQNLVRIGGLLEAWKISVVYRDREIP